MSGENEDVKPDEKEPTPGVPMEDVKELVSSFKETVEALKNQPTPAPSVQDSEDFEKQRNAAIEEYNAAREKANKLAADGDHAGATEVMYAAHLKVQQMSSQDPSSTPAGKALINQAKRHSKSSNAELYDKYGGEIEARMAHLPVEQRIDPDAWDEAARAVRANHMDEILAEERKKWESEQRSPQAPPTPPVARGAHRSTPSDAPVQLTEDQLAAARSMGFTPERYAEAVKKYEEAEIKPGTVRLLDDETIKPGRF